MVLVVDQMLPRNMWCLGRIVKITENEDGHVRLATVRVSRTKGDTGLNFKSTLIERPIAKLVLLVPNEVTAPY